MVQLYNGDCLEVMKQLPSGSIDLVLCDLPYGTTGCKWDTIIPFAPLWSAYTKLMRNGSSALVFTASQPFTSALVMSKVEWFRYQWIWQKERPGNPQLAKQQPLKIHEDVMVFSARPHRYTPQGLKEIPEEERKIHKPEACFSIGAHCRKPYVQTHTGYPKSIQCFGSERGQHPTQKPVALMEYLIKTYTKEGDTVLDNTMGSGTTGVACVNTGRNFIGIEKDSTYFEICKQRIQGAEVVEWTPQPTGEMCLSHTEENCKRCGL